MRHADASQIPPLPDRAEDIRRSQHTRRTRRMMYSEHERDLHELLMRQLGPERAAVWGKPDMTANPGLSLWTQVAVLYSEEPDASSIDGAGEPVADAVAEAGYWGLMQRVQRDTLALREMLVRVDEVDGQVTHRPVFPDLVQAEVHRRRPAEPVRIREAVYDEQHQAWTWHDVSIADPAAPYFRVLEAQGRNDITGDVLGDRFEGAAYPYRLRDGTPVLPYQVYHAAKTGRLFDPYTLCEITEGSLNLGVLLTYYGHLIRHVAWMQRWAIGAEPVGLETTNEDSSTLGRQEVPVDPSVLLRLEKSHGFDGQPMVGQWANPADPEAVLRSIVMYERRLLLLAGFQPPDVSKTEADIRSGYSLAVDRERAREMQRVYAPLFRRADLGVMALSAVLLNRATGTDYPEDPAAYRVVYQGLPLSPAEMTAKREELVGLIDAGLMDKPTAYRHLNPEVTTEEAVIALDRIRATNQLFSAEPGAGGGAGGDGAAKAADTALNGAQVEAAIGIVERVAGRRIPRAVGVSMLTEFFNLDPARAERIMGSVGRDFFVDPAVDAA